MTQGLGRPYHYWFDSTHIQALSGHPRFQICTGCTPSQPPLASLANQRHRHLCAPPRCHRLFLICIAFIKLHGRHYYIVKLSQKRLSTQSPMSWYLKTVHECIPSRASGQPTPVKRLQNQDDSIRVYLSAQLVVRTCLQSLALPAYQTCKSEFKHYCLGQKPRVLAYELPVSQADVVITTFSQTSFMWKMTEIATYSCVCTGIASSLMRGISSVLPIQCQIECDRAVSYLHIVDGSLQAHQHLVGAILHRAQLAQAFQLGLRVGTRIIELMAESVQSGVSLM